MSTLALVAGLHAQTSTAALTGTIHDASNAVVSKAAVTLTNPETGISRSADGSGKRSIIVKPVNTNTEKNLLYRQWVLARAHQARTGGRDTRGARADQPGDRRDDRGVDAHGREPPPARLREARRPGPRRARRDAGEQRLTCVSEGR